MQGSDADLNFNAWRLIRQNPMTQGINNTSPKILECGRHRVVDAIAGHDRLGLCETGDSWILRRGDVSVTGDWSAVWKDILCHYDRAYLRETGPLPWRSGLADVMVLELIMPGIDVFQVLQAKGQDLDIRDIPVIVLTSMDPTSGPIVSSALHVGRGGGLSVRDLLDCIRAISSILNAPA